MKYATNPTKKVTQNAKNPDRVRSNRGFYRMARQPWQYLRLDSLLVHAQFARPAAMSVGFIIDDLNAIDQWRGSASFVRNISH